MRITATAPCRLSLFGGGTDVGEYANKYNGVCINMAINIYQHITLGDSPNLYSYIDGSDPKFYEAFFKDMDYKPKYLHQDFDNSIHSGLGTSASLGVALTSLLSRIKGYNLSRYEIAEKAWDIEVNKIGLFGGKQDQFASAFGGFNLMKFQGVVEVQSFPRGIAQNIADHILLFNTGIHRKNPNLQNNLKEISPEQKSALDILKELANDAYHRIYGGDIKGLGRILNDTWNYKKKSNQVSTPEIDEIYEKALKAGAYGGKLCGSGQGGYMIFIADKKKHEDIKKALDLKWVDFSIDWNGVMTRFI